MNTRLSLILAASATSLILLGAAAPLDPMPAQQHPSGIRLAGLFGESDEEKAARLAAEQKERDQDAAIANLSTQVNDLQDTVRRLTGQNEALSHKVDVLNDKIDRMQKDFDYKLCTISAQQVGGDVSSIPCGAQNSSSDFTPAPSSSNQAFMPLPSSSAPTGGAPRSLAPPPGVLGTLPAGSSAKPVPPGSTADASVSPYRAEYDTALNLLGKAQYDEARAAFRAFADSHPKDSLASEAVYWVGNISYVQKDYQGAGQAFVEEIKKFPSGNRAPESMYKLGQSLIAMGKKKEGCFTLGSLPSTYPKASKTTLAQAVTARKAAGCK